MISWTGLGSVHIERPAQVLETPSVYSTNHNFDIVSMLADVFVRLFPGSED